MVTSPAARPEDSDTCSAHPSQAGIAADTALEDQAMEECKDKPAQETDKRVEPAAYSNQVFNISIEVRPEDTELCSSHLSHVQQANTINADDTTVEDHAIKESKKEPTQEIDEPEH